MANSDDDMDKPVTKRELYEALELWGGALEARIGVTIDNCRSELRAEIQALGKWLSAEFAQHANRMLDTVKEITGAVDEKYNDLPGRVAVLEAKVLPPRRQRRR